MAKIEKIKKEPEVIAKVRAVPDAEMKKVEQQMLTETILDMNKRLKNIEAKLEGEMIPVSPNVAATTKILDNKIEHVARQISPQPQPKGLQNPMIQQLLMREMMKGEGDTGLNTLYRELGKQILPKLLGRLLPSSKELRRRVIK